MEKSDRIAVSRVKKIVQLDDDIVQCSTNATFVISVATVCDQVLVGLLGRDHANGG